MTDQSEVTEAEHKTIYMWLCNGPEGLQPVAVRLPNGQEHMLTSIGRDAQLDKIANDVVDVIGQNLILVRSQGLQVMEVVSPKQVIVTPSGHKPD